MPSQRVPLVGMPNQRNYDSLATLISGKDQRFIGGILGIIKNPLAGHMKVYFEKRPGLETSITPASGSVGEAIFYSRSQGAYVSAFQTGGTTTVFFGTTDCGDI